MDRSDFLFATPSFIGGMSSVLDLGATLVVYNEAPSRDIADKWAIRSDWVVSGEDIRSAMKVWEQECNDQEE
jgi:hypothetical protein